jgi:hypothetical protein
LIETLIDVAKSVNFPIGSHVCRIFHHMKP